MKVGSLVIVTSGILEGCEAKVLATTKYKAMCDVYDKDGTHVTLELPKAALKVKR